MSHYMFQRSVLIIDDPQGFETLIREGLFSCSAQFQFCPSIADEAATILKQERPDLVMITHDFQVGTVAEFVKTNAELLCQAPCICIGKHNEWTEDLSALKKFEILERSLIPASVCAHFLGEERKRRIVVDPLSIKM